MPWALSISEKKNASLAVICYHRFIIFAEENVTWQIQLIWLSFAIIFSSFCWRKSNMVDSAYLDIICLHLFTLLLGEKWHGRLSLSGCPFVFIFSSFLWKKKWHGSFSFSGWHLLSFFHHLWQKKNKQTWQIRVGCSDSKYMLLAYFFLGI